MRFPKIRDSCTAEMEADLSRSFVEHNDHFFLSCSSPSSLLFLVSRLLSSSWPSPPAFAASSCLLLSFSSPLVFCFLLPVLLSFISSVSCLCRSLSFLSISNTTGPPHLLLLSFCVYLPSLFSFLSFYFRLRLLHSPAKAVFSSSPSMALSSLTKKSECIDAKSTPPIVILHH